MGGFGPLHRRLLQGGDVALDPVEFRPEALGDLRVADVRREGLLVVVVGGPVGVVGLRVLAVAPVGLREVDRVCRPPSSVRSLAPSIRASARSMRVVAASAPSSESSRSLRRAASVSPIASRTASIASS
ncbi:hypothetical protein ACFQL4_08295 [Halosimplex aquaticum]